MRSSSTCPVSSLISTRSSSDEASILCVSPVTLDDCVDQCVSAKYVSEQMRLETSFKNEANNARRCAELLAQTPELRDDVYVPRVYGTAEGCAESDRIMVMEYIEGCRWGSIFSACGPAEGWQTERPEGDRGDGPEAGRLHGPGDLDDVRNDLLVGVRAL